LRVLNGAPSVGKGRAYSYRRLHKLDLSKGGAELTSRCNKKKLRELHEHFAQRHPRPRTCAQPIQPRLLEQRTLELDHSHNQSSGSNLASLLQAQGKLGEAEPLIRRALESRERTLGPEHSGALTSVSN